MAFDEVREILQEAAWSRTTPLVALFDEPVEKHDAPPYQGKHSDDANKALRGRVTTVFAGLTLPSASTGQIVQMVIGLRRANGLPLYELEAEETTQ